MYPYPDRKKYIYTIPTTKGDLVLKLEQATANETKEFYSIMEIIYKGDIKQKMKAINKINQYYIGLLKSKSNYKWYNINKIQVLSLVKKNLASYIDELVQMLHPTRKSIYSETQMPKINGKKPRLSLFTNDKEAIYKKTGIPADEIYDRLTMEQIGWYLDKIVFEVYEDFKEGKSINDRLCNNGGLSDQDKKDLEFIKSQKR